MKIWKTFLKMGKKVSMLKIIYSGICKLETGSRENYSRNPEYETKKRFQDQILQRTPIQGYCLCKKINILILQTYGNEKRGS